MSDSQDAVDKIRQMELKGRRRKQLMIIGSSSFLLVLVVVVVVAVVCTSKFSNNPGQDASTSGMHTSYKPVEMFCSSTDYRSTCEASLSKVVKSDNPEPKELVKGAISVILEEVGTAFNKTQAFKTEDDRVKGAIEDCMELYIICKDELQHTLAVIVERGMEHLNERSSDIRIWLSAVMSYQETCVDGFPDEDWQKKVQNVMTRVRELTSNGLAIIRKASEFLVMLNVDGLGGKRRLLEEDEAEDEFPEWVSEEERRVLKEEANITLKANVTVAKDGSGQFKTISAALEAMPKKRKGR